MIADVEDKLKSRESKQNKKASKIKPSQKLYLLRISPFYKQEEDGDHDFQNRISFSSGFIFAMPSIFSTKKGH